jgi:hypothetical protein
MDPIALPSSISGKSGHLAYEAISTLPRMVRSNSSHDLRDFEAPTRIPSKSRARHQTLAYGVSASDLVTNGPQKMDPFSDISGFSASNYPHNQLGKTGNGNDILLARVPSREGEIYDVRGFESDMSDAIMNARVRRKRRHVVPNVLYFNQGECRIR